MHSPCWGRTPTGWSVRVWHGLLQHEQVGPVSWWGSLWAVRLDFILEPNLQREMDRGISFFAIIAVSVFIFSQWLLKNFGYFGNTSDLYKDWQTEIISRLNICGDGVVWAQCEFSLLWLNTDCSKQDQSKVTPSKKQKSAEIFWPFVHHFSFLKQLCAAGLMQCGFEKTY